MSRTRAAAAEREIAREQRAGARAQRLAALSAEHERENDEMQRARDRAVQRAAPDRREEIELEWDLEAARRGVEQQRELQGYDDEGVDRELDIEGLRDLRIPYREFDPDAHRPIDLL